MRTTSALLGAVAALVLAGTAGGAATAAKVTVTPQLVRAGGTIKIAGAGFRPTLKVTLYIGRPRTDNVARIGIRYAGKAGGFRLEKHISRTTPAGQWAIRACQRNCRIQGVGAFRVAKVKPL
jgi:hypothetical protein